jgi:DNA-binding Xre family transcriptional regulator
VQIEKYIQNQKLTQTQLAEMMEVDQAVISRISNGSNITLKTLEKFCLATNSKIMIVPNI